MTTLYTKANCTQCAATKRHLNRAHIPYTEVYLEDSPEALELVKGMGYLEAPVVVAGSQSWSGYRPDLIDKFLFGVM